MKRIIVILFVLLPMLLNAGVILKRTGDKIEDVSIKSVTETEIIYISTNGEEISILKSDVSAVLYDDGRYEEFKVSQRGSNDTYVAKEESNNTQKKRASVTNTVVASGVKIYNVFAYGVYALYYVYNQKYNGAKVEYRIIYKSQSEIPEFQYLGTTPFAHCTEQAYNNVSTAFANLQIDTDVRPLVVEDASNVDRVEFRLSLDGYKTVVVKPMKDILLVGGNVMFIPLQKLKPLK